ncbi:hypothetical protein LTR10_000109 [Elasticomyces elasticus]|nr:hypothetical protein LTR10_000109 [Elasticomyces elasticus]KAK4980632.1 hypothetical protein LTR42_000940 [Elasticomyces elasticus]
MAFSRNFARLVMNSKETLDLICQDDSYPLGFFLKVRTDSMRLRPSQFGRGRLYRAAPRKVRSPSPMPPPIPGPYTPPHRMPRLTLARGGRIIKRWHASTYTGGYTRPVGLYNSGNLCYRNALLQCLLHTPVFYNCLGRIHFKCSKQADQCVTCALQALAHDYWLNRNPQDPQPNFPTNTAKVLHQAVINTCPLDDDFAVNADGSEQADPIEFLTFLRKRLIEAEDPHTNRVDSVLQMQIEQTGTCTEHNCGFQNPPETIESYLTSVAMADDRAVYNELSLLGCVKATFKENVQARCEGCAAKKLKPETQDSTRALERRIVKAPALLAIQLQRVVYDVTEPLGVVQRKLSNKVPFDEDLDLSEFTKDGSSLKYRLHGVIGRRGDTTDEGHYIAAVRDHDGTGFSIVNDHLVRRNYTGSFREMREPRASPNGTRCSPYIFIYQQLG